MPQKPEIAQIKGLTIWWVILIIVAVIVVGVVALSLIFPREPTPAPVLPPADRGEPTPAKKMTQCMGTIQEIEGSTITINCEKARNVNLNQDTTLEVTLNANTEGCIPYEKLYDQEEDQEGNIILKPKPGVSPSKELQQTLDPQTMQIGASLMAAGSQDITKTTSFTATTACYYPKK